MSRATVSAFGHRGTTSSIRTEIVRELVNASDGAGLHFQSGGNIDIASPPDLGTKLSFEFVCKLDDPSGTQNGLLVDFGGGSGRAIFGASSSISGNFGIYYNSAWATFGLNPLTDGSVHHLIASIDGTTATLYDNGNQIATATIGSLNIDGCTDARIGTNFVSTGGFFEGTIYRARFYNKALTSAEVQSAYERADVDYADQYGSQTSKILNGTSWTSASGTTPPASWTAGSGQVPNFTIDSSSGSGSEPALKFQRGANNMPYFFQTFTAVIGKKYRVAYRVKNIDAIHIRVGIGNTAVGTQYNVSDYTSTDWADYEDTFTATTTTFSIYVQANTITGTQGGYIDSVTVEQVGVVTDLDLAFANPTQSLTVQDRSGAADGTASSSGVSQVQPVVQLNSTSARIGTSTLQPADGELMVDSVDVRNGNVRVIGGNQVQLLNAANDTNVDIINSGGTGVAKLGLRVAGSEKVTIDSSGLTTLTAGSNGVDDETLKLAFDLSGTSKVMGSIGTTNVDASNGGLTFKTVSGGTLGERMTISSTGQVGISCTPNANLEVAKSSTTDGPVIRLTNQNDSISAGGTHGAIEFFSGDNSNPADQVVSSIKSVHVATAPNFGELSFSTGSNTEAMRIDSTGQVTVNELAGSATNSTKLEVRSDADGSTSAIRTTNKDTTAGTNQAAGVDFGLSRNSGAFKPQAGQIKVGREADWTASDTNIDSYMAFSTYANNALGERMRIASSGNVGINCNAPTVGQLQIDHSSGSTLALTRTAGATTGTLGLVRFGNRSVDSNLANILVFQDNATDAAAIAFQTQATGGSTATRLTIGSNGVCTFGVGINLGHENLTKYDEGTFTPTISAETGTINGTNIEGRYTRIGNVCHVWFTIECTGVSGASGAVQFSGFPFTSSSIASGFNTPMVVRYVNLGSAVESLVLRLFNNSQGGRIEEQNGTGVANLADNVQNGTIFQVAGSYRLSSG